MTRPIRLTDDHLKGLNAIQREMMLGLAKEINDCWELQQITLPQSEEVLRRVLAVIERLNESNKLASRTA